MSNSLLKRTPLLALAFAGLSVQVVLCELPKIPPVSTFAPAKDLLQQVDFFVARVEDSVSDENDFEGAKQSRTVKDGNTLAALALVLAQHDEDYAEKKAMPAMLSAAQKLAQADEDWSKARAARAEFKAARSTTTAPAAADVKWEKVASLSALMKQVPLIHTGLKRGVDGNRLARTASQSAGQAAALAAIAQASMLDNEYVKSPADEAAWQTMCAAMRDAAGEVNSAVRAQDAKRVGEAMSRLNQSCETCHARFRHP